MVSSLAFVPIRTPNPEHPIFEEPFNYLTTGLLNGAFSPWKDGARVTVSLAEDRREPGNRSMRVDLLGPNQRTTNRDASVFRILQLEERRWSSASAARFWIENPSDFPLILSFNFKEEFNEYWATSGSQIYFLEDEQGGLLRQSAQYGNLPIPSGYIGFVAIPFEGMAVPEWNTARGDFKMDTSAVESFAIGINVDQHYPRHFIVDDFQVRTAQFPYLDISGPDEIDIPASGELRQQYAVTVVVPDWKIPLEIVPSWKLERDINPAISIDENGWLVVPAGIDNQEITLTAQYPYADRLLIAKKGILLKSAQAEAVPSSTQTPIVSDPALREKSAYEQFSENFDTWSFENRPLFVVISIGVIVLIMVVLAYFQRRMR